MSAWFDRAKAAVCLMQLDTQFSGPLVVDDQVFGRQSNKWGCRWIRKTFFVIKSTKDGSEQPTAIGRASVSSALGFSNHQNSSRVPQDGPQLSLRGLLGLRP